MPNDSCPVILYQDGYIQLDYDPVTDVLCAQCPDIQQEDLLRLYDAFYVIVETIVNKDIKHFLLDASNSKTTVTEDEYYVVMEQLVQALQATKLHKLARVVSASSMREHHAAQYITASQHLFPYSIQNFTSKNAALQWLKSS